MRAVLSLSVILALTGCVEHERRKTATGAEDFASFCAGCHGAGAQGNGPDAAALAIAPADLTRLRRDAAGGFPATRVMAKIWGKSGQANPNVDSHADMPAFASLMDSELVPFDGGDGRQTPTPRRLVQISNYLESLQK